MRTVTITLTLFLVSLFSVSAGIFSAPTNGIYVAVTEWMGGDRPGTNEPFQFNHKFDWAAYCNTGKVSIWYPIDPAYGLKVKLLAQDGKEVTKTALGDAFGSNWARLHDYKSTRLQPIEAWGSFESNQGESSGGILPSPRELFQIQEPGIYTMEIEIQMFRYVRTKDTDEWYRNLLRFSPIKIKVEKPPVAKASSSLNVQTNLPAK